MQSSRPKTICNNCATCPCKTGESPLFHYRGGSPDLAVWYGRGDNNVSHSMLYRKDETPQTIQLYFPDLSGANPLLTASIPTITTSSIGTALTSR